ncbi:hypothetical protein [Micromonospora peucetia]|uniref:Uncharacterized protein n=1 Tax=Micromonospora peucetia TaxID=47871 RepID=A0A1C6VNN0_9ACTN|nr:hypothetical protein [Micromonospora peucetia]SCL67500.1 hypothetical protein GA0070608_3523 [Micromonospora peucetia]
MPQSQVRFIKAYVIHGRTTEGLLNYPEFFHWLVNLPYGRTRIDVSSNVVLAIVRSVEREGMHHFRFVSGNPRDIPILYDESTGTTVQGRTPEGTWLVQSTRVSVAPEDRCVFIESRRVGVGATNLERYFNNIARNLGFVEKLHVDLSPMPSPSFEEDINQLVRIREAALVVARPNSDWDDSSDLLSRLADDSNAGEAEIAVKAERGKSLSRTSGAIRLVKQHLRDGLHNLRNIRIVGRREGEAADRILTLDKHQMRTTTRINSAAPQEEQDEQVFAAAEELAEAALPLVRERARQASG